MRQLSILGAPWCLVQTPFAARLKTWPSEKTQSMFCYNQVEGCTYRIYRRYVSTKQSGILVELDFTKVPKSDGFLVAEFVIWDKGNKTTYSWQRLCCQTRDCWFTQVPTGVHLLQPGGYWWPATAALVAFVEKSGLCDSCSDHLSYKCHFVQMPPTLTEHEVECSEPVTSPRYQRLEFSEVLP